MLDRSITLHLSPDPHLPPRHLSSPAQYLHQLGCHNVPYLLRPQRSLHWTISLYPHLPGHRGGFKGSRCDEAKATHTHKHYTHINVESTSTCTSVLWMVFASIWIKCNSEMAPRNLLWSPQFVFPSPWDISSSSQLYHLTLVVHLISDDANWPWVCHVHLIHTRNYSA